MVEAWAMFTSVWRSSERPQDHTHTHTRFPQTHVHICPDEEAPPLGPRQFPQTTRMLLRRVSVVAAVLPSWLSAGEHHDTSSTDTENHSSFYFSVVISVAERTTLEIRRQNSERFKAC